MDGDRILIVENEDTTALLIEEHLNAAGARTFRIADARGVCAWVSQNRPSAVVLDVMMPRCDGMSLCRKLRTTSTVPIILLSARASESDRLTGFAAGADDYVCKPFFPRELVARTSAVLRRASTERAPPPERCVSLDQATQSASANGLRVPLTLLEFELLAVLMAAPGRIFSREEIMDRVYRDFRVVSDRTIDSHVKKLRRKLAFLEIDPQPVRSVYGSGYKFEAPLSGRAGLLSRP